MKILNISKIGNIINNLNIVGIKKDGNLILIGTAENIDCFGSGLSANRIIFYEYNPVTEDLKSDIFQGLKAMEIRLNDNKVNIGSRYFIEVENKKKINIVKCDYDNYTYKRLYSILDDENNKICDYKIHLITLTTDLIAIKVYNETYCKIYLYDDYKQEKYELLFSEEDDMRYADIKYLVIDNNPCILFIKYAKLDLKMEYYIHKWEQTKEFKKIKTEKIFFFPLRDLIKKGNIYLDEKYKIVHVDDNYTLLYHTYADDRILYSIFDHRKYDDKRLFEDTLFIYDILKNEIAIKINYNGNILISNNGDVYLKIKDKQQYAIRDFKNNKLYKLPYKDIWIESIINNLLLLKIKHGIIIYDFKNEFEYGKYYTEDKKLFILPQVRNMAMDLNYKYFKIDDSLILF